MPDRRSLRQQLRQEITVLRDRIDRAFSLLDELDARDEPPHLSRPTTRRPEPVEPEAPFTPLPDPRPPSEH